MLSGLIYLNSLDRSISYIGDVWLLFFIKIMFCCVENSELNANSVDPDQMPHSVAWPMIWVCTVCQCSFYGSLGLNGLSGLVQIF